MSVRLFVGNLPYDTTEADLRALFSAVGQLSYAYLPTDRESGKPRGFAFVEFTDDEQAKQAVNQFNNQLYKGRPLAVNEARGKDSPGAGRPPMGSRPSMSSVRPPGGYTPGGFNSGGFKSEPPSEPTTRNFGPPATPRRAKKHTGRGGPGGERVPKGPLKEKTGGQFFGADTDEDNLEDDDFTGENFASSEAIEEE